MTVLVNQQTPDTYRVTQPTRSNAKAWARKFEARLLEPGIVSYEDAGCGKAFLTKEDIGRSINSFIGRPLILTPKLRHKKVTPADLEKEARGYITETYYNPEDGWFWARGICHDDEVKDAIDRVGFCSCAYQVMKVGPGGEYHAIPYQEQIVEFSGEHLAIVDRPRYEGATIRLNSKPTKNMPIIKWFKQLASRQNSTEVTTPTAPAAAPAAPAAPAAAPAAATSKENSLAEEIKGETELEIPTRENGKTEKVTLATLVDAYNSHSAGISPDAEVDIGGKPVSIKTLVAAYNAKTEEDEKAEKEKKDKENAAPPAPTGAAPTGAAKENAQADSPKHFKVLMNARHNGSINEGPKASPDSLTDRCNRGSERYGSALAGKN